MKSIKNKISLFIVICVSLVAGITCEKPFDLYRNAQPVESVSLNMYQFLERQNNVYDTLLYLLDKTGLDKVIKEGEVTFFAPQDASILTVLGNLNETRQMYGKHTVWYIDSVPTPVWDTLLKRYIISGVVNSDSLNYADGVDLITMSYGYEMNGKRTEENASGIVDGGPFQILYSDKNNSRFIKDWSRSLTQTIDIKTANGMVHVLEDRHLFGFNSFISMAFPESLVARQEPYSGVPAPIPGVIQAVDYDFGGEGVSYHDNDPGNNGGQYRSDDVDIVRSNEGGHEIGWTNSGEWLRYTVDVAETGWYQMDLRASSPNYNGFQHYSVSFDGKDVTGILGISGTGDYQNFESWNTSYVYLEKGVQVMQMNELSCCYDFKSFTFTKMDQPPPLSTSFHDAPMNIPGFIPAADYDKGGQGIAYNDMDRGNTGGAYRMENVDIRFGPEPVPIVGWTFAGEWTKYTVNVQAGGDYKVKFRYGVPGTCIFRLEFDGVDKTGPVSVPGTGDWSIFQTAEFTVTGLEPGVHVMKFYLISGNFDFASFDFIKQ